MKNPGVVQILSRLALVEPEIWSWSSNLPTISEEPEIKEEEGIGKGTMGALQSSVRELPPPKFYTALLQTLKSIESAIGCM